MFAEIRALPPADAIRRMQVIYTEPIKLELVISRLAEICGSSVTVAAALSARARRNCNKTVVEAGVDLFVIRGTTVSAEHRPKKMNRSNFQEVHLRA
jgi:hypothetical protein